MKLGIDVRPLQAETRHRGIGKALGRTLTPLLEIADKNGDECVLFFDPQLPKPDIVPLNNITFSEVKTPAIYKKPKIRVVARPMKKINPVVGSVDVLLQFDFGLGVPTKVPSVVMFHDLIPVLFRNQDLKRQKHEKTFIKKLKQKSGSTMQWSRYTKDLKSYEKATKIVAISECSKKDILNFNKNIKPNRVSVAYLGVDKVLNKTNEKITNDVVKNILKDKYILYVGGIDTRKNVVELIRIFYKLKPENPELKLLVVGKEFGLKENLEDIGWFKELDKKPDYKKDVISPGYVSDGELQLLYKNAQAFIFPSLYEGFGMPVLEAMALGCPVVAYKNSSIAEVAGDAALLLKDGDDLSPPTSKLLKDQSLRRKLIKAGKDRVRLFPWENTAKVLFDEMQKVAKSGK